MRHNELNHINLEGMIERAIYKKTAVALQFLSTVTSRGFQKFFRSSDNCCALFERSEFAKAVIHRRTKEFRKRKWVTIDQNRNSQRIISILLSHHTLKLKINKTHYEAVHAPCL